jgi:hypothetical protein
MALHEQAVGATDEWYTPPYVFGAMGAYFDLDVASPGHGVVPWIPTTMHITGNSLRHDWAGFVWMNPPFGGRNAIIPWLEKFFTHRNGVALVPDRTSCPWWQTYTRAADLALFVAGKIKFIGADGQPGDSPAQGTTLLALGSDGVTALRRAERAGLGFCMAPEFQPRTPLNASLKSREAI